jgi:hypothetical protein
MIKERASRFREALNEETFFGLGALRCSRYSPCITCMYLVAASFISPTRLSSPTSPVRPVRMRLISTTSTTRKRRVIRLMRLAATKEETDVSTPVSKRIMLVAATAAMHIAGMDMEKGIC